MIQLIIHNLQELDGLKKIQAVKILLNKYNIPNNIVDQVQPIITANIQNRQVATTGQPYFYNQNITSRNKIQLYNHHRQGWELNRWFDSRDNRYNYQFIKEFKQTFQWCQNPL